MITDERLKQLMEQVGMPDSRSLLQALRQCDMEARIDEREKCTLKAIDDRLARIEAILIQQQQLSQQAMLQVVDILRR